MATITTHTDLYIDVRKYLIELLKCNPKEVIQGYQNDSPFPLNAVVMNITHERAIDVPVSRYRESEEKAIIQQSIEVLFQLDFYGQQAQERCQKVAIAWKSFYTVDGLNKCKPLYAKDPRRLPIVNEQSMYEDRWSLEVLLQYNPEVEHRQDFLDVPTFSIVNL